VRLIRIKVALKQNLADGNSRNRPCGTVVR
jgi:hypothetical protein